jgi:prepilin-type processing-associated H-X9-DG protein
MSVARRKSIEWLADQMVFTALNHPTVPSELGFGAVWKNVRINYSLSRREPNVWVYSYEIQLLTGDIVLAHVTVQTNPDYPSTPKGRRQQEASVHPVEVTFFYQHDSTLAHQRNFNCAYADGHLALSVLEKASYY